MIPIHVFVMKLKHHESIILVVFIYFDTGDGFTTVIVIGDIMFYFSLVFFVICNSAFFFSMDNEYLVIENQK